MLNLHPFLRKFLKDITHNHGLRGKSLRITLQTSPLTQEIHAGVPLSTIMRL